MTDSMDNKQATLDLGTKPVGSLLLQYATPAIIAMTAASLYNIIDRMFIGQNVGPLAISGLAVTFPFMMLTSAFGAAVGVGSSTAISVKLGQKDYATANNILGNTLILNLIVGLLVGLIGLAFIDPILRFFGGSDQTLPYGRQFMQIILLGNVFSHTYFGMNAVLRAIGKPRQAMMATIFTVCMNIFLDVIFIIVLGWGIRGAAFATVISQVMALCWQMHLFNKQDELLHLQRGIYRLKKEIVRNIIAVGISPFMMNACACLIVRFMNKQFVTYGGDLAVGAFGISNSMAFFFLMTVMGLTQGMQPIVSYNYGAQQIKRMLAAVKLSIVVATVIMIIGWLIAMFLPHFCARLFTKDLTLMHLATKAIRIDMLVFPIVGAQVVITNFFQCIRKVKISIFLSLSRQLLFLLPLLYFLPPHFGVDGVWYSLPASDATAAIVAMAMMYAYTQRLNKQLNTQQP